MKGSIKERFIFSTLLLKLAQKYKIIDSLDLSAWRDLCDNNLPGQRYGSKNDGRLFIQHVIGGSI